MNNNIISLIIPFRDTNLILFNKMLNSIKKQNLNHMDVIFIDDNSENSQIYKKIIEKNNFRYYKFNKDPSKFNLGQCRDFGVTKALGKYIWFIDSDDEIVEDSIDFLMDKFNKYPDIDYIFFGYANKYNDKLVNIFNNDIEFIYDFSSQNWNKKLNIFFYENFQSDWRVCFKKEFIEKNHIYHHSDIEKYEDIYFSIKYKIKSKKVYFTTKTLYLYNRLNSFSTLNTLSKDMSRKLRIIPLKKIYTEEKKAPLFNYFSNYYDSFFLFDDYKNIYEKLDIYKKMIKKNYKFRNLKTLGFTKKWLFQNILIFLWIFMGKGFNFFIKK